MNNMLRGLILGVTLVLMMTSVMPTSSASTSSNVLHGLVAIGPNDVWATGYYISGTIHRTLGEHWDGQAWQVVSTPSPGTRSDLLNQPAAVTSNDVWVAGDRDNKDTEGPGSHTLIEHWNGSVWSAVTSPNVSGAVQNVLRGCTAPGSSDVWVGGYYKPSGSPRRTLVEHWNGSTWSIVSSPNASSDANAFSQLASAGPSDVWAVGNSTINGTPRSLIEHWNGSRWQILASPSPGVGGSYPEGTLLWGVAARSPDDAWAVGQYYDGHAVRALALHWNGTAWTQTATPSVGTGENQLRGITIFSANDAWAVGWSNVAGSDETLIEHWDGTSWSVVTSANGTGDSYLKGVAAIGSNDVWAAGYSSQGGIYQTLTEHWDGTAWSVVSSANA